MGVIELSTLLILFLYVVIRGKNREKTLCLLAMFILFSVSALRNISVGGDIVRYVESYKKYSLFDFDGVINYLNKEEVKDPVYYFSTWAFSRIFKNPQWWLAFNAFLFQFSVAKLIYIESKKTIISIIVFLALGFFSFGLTGLRQTMAMSVVLLSYPFLKNRKPIKFIITIIIASLFHKTSLVFLIAYPIVNIKLGKYHFIVSAIAFVIFYSGRGWLMNFMSHYLQEERYEGYLSGEASQYTFVGFFIQLVVFIFCLYYYKQHTQNDKKAIILYNLAFIGVLFQLFASFIAEIFRVSMYFSQFNIILLANSTVTERDPKSRKIAQLIIIIVMLLYMFKDGERFYEFFWQ